MNKSKHPKANEKNKFILIDDDHAYQAIMLKFARKHGIDLDVYDSLLELGSIGLLGRYDAAIIDYDLGQINGVEIAEYLSALFGDIPMILVSNSKRDPGDKPWPQSIKRFVKKSDGYDSILYEARHALEKVQTA